MGNDRHFESTYVGRFVSDGISFNLRPASSGRNQSTSFCRSTSTKSSYEQPNNIQNIYEMNSTTPSTPVTPNSTPHIVPQTATRTAPTPTITTSPEISINSPSTSSSSPARIPIWLRGTASRPGIQGPQSHTTQTIRRIQSQATISTNTVPKTPPRKSSLGQNITRNNAVSSQRTTPPLPTINRNSIRSEMPAPRRTFSMPSVATNPGQNESHRLSQTTVARERRFETANPLLRNTVYTNRFSTVPTASPVSSPAGRREMGSSTATIRQSSPLSVRSGIPASAIPRIVSRVTTTPRITQVQRTSVAKPSIPHELRSRVSQSQLQQSSSVNDKPQRKPIREGTRLMQYKDGKGKSEDEGECCVCMNAESDSVLYRCGHVCACLPCAKALKQCPICREQVTDVIKIWKI